MATNNKYLQYKKSHKKTEINIDIQNLAIEYSKLLNKKFIYVFSGGEQIEFQFKTENFYHLLGFQKLSDVTVVRMIQNEKLSKSDFYEYVKDRKITMDFTDTSIIGDFDTKIVNMQDTSWKSKLGEVKANRFQYFTEAKVLEMLIKDPVIDFDPETTDTLIEADKIFFEYITDQARNLNLFIGYDEKKKIYYPPTFFLEMKKDNYKYRTDGEPHPELKILSRCIVNTENNVIIDFKIKWQNVRAEFKGTVLYDGQRWINKWIKSPHILSAQVESEIEIQKEKIIEYEEELKELKEKQDIVTLICQLQSEKKEDAQLALIEHGIDAENEEDLRTFTGVTEKSVDIEVANMVEKLKTMENKYQKHNQYLPVIMELEEKEVMFIYGYYVKGKAFDREIIRTMIQELNLFEEPLLPKQFLEEYEKIKNS